MTQEEKQLLLKDISTRLPYGLKIEEYNEEYGFNDSELSVVSMKYFADDEASAEGYWINRIENIKPYLRPMSSMTEEERNELVVVCSIDYIDEKIVDFGEFLCEGSPVNIKNIYGLLDWLNKKMFDYRGLIPKGLALEAKEDMYNV